jgi:hypothetical protein
MRLTGPTETITATVYEQVQSPETRRTNQGTRKLPQPCAYGTSPQFLVEVSDPVKAVRQLDNTLSLKILLFVPWLAHCGWAA